MNRRLILFLFLIGCSSSGTFKTSPVTGNNTFVFSDHSGKYIMSREVKLKSKKLISRVKLFPSNSTAKPLETAVNVYNSGSYKKQIALLPAASQFSVWLDKKKYLTQIKIDKTKKKIIATTKSPEEKFNGTKEVAIPKGRYFCFFSTFAECVISQNLLISARDKKVPVHIIWDNYPFQLEQYDGLPQELVTLASFAFSEKQKLSLRFELDIGNQIIFYHFDRQLKFEKLFWINQGISLLRIESNSPKENK